MKLLRNEGRDKLCLEREYLENIIEKFYNVCYSVIRDLFKKRKKIKCLEGMTAE